MLREDRTWPKSILGRSGHLALEDRRVRRRLALVSAAIAGSLAIGVGGYAVGASQVSDADDARQAGMVAGEQVGSAVGAREGFERAFRPARKRAYGEAYREAYRAAYRRAFEQADLSSPRRVRVSGP